MPFSTPTFRSFSPLSLALLVGVMAVAGAAEPHKPEPMKTVVAQIKPGVPGISPERSPSVLPAPALEKTAEPVAPPIFRARPGPWGELDYFTVYLEASTALLKSMDVPSFDTIWKFVKWKDDQVTQLFESAKIAEPFKSQLLDRSKWRRDADGITVVPSPEAVLSLSNDARTAIYQVLGRWEENSFHHEPSIIPGHDVRAWLKRANLSNEILTTIERTSYQRGKSLVFADLPLLLRMVPSEADRLTIRKALSRTPTLVINLRLTPNTDIEKITQYWGGYTRSKDVAPFLESISNNPAVNAIDIIHLLPSGVRGLLYTFPGQNHGRTGYYPDCHWTSLNFANFEPLARLADPAMATAYTLENYTRVTSGTYQFGDVLFFMDGSSGNAVHSCVFIADDIVFTKNGRSPTQPWVLMKLDDVVEVYSMFYQTQIACYRRKND